MRHHRPERVSDLIIEELNKIIFKEFEFPDIILTITDIEVTKKLDYAFVKISAWPSEKAATALKILEKNQPRLQRILMKKINIRPMPKISFKIDYGPQKAAAVEKQLLKEN